MHIIVVLNCSSKVLGRIQLFHYIGNTESIHIEIESIGITMTVKTDVISSTGYCRHNNFCHFIISIDDVQIFPKQIRHTCHCRSGSPINRKFFCKSGTSAAIIELYFIIMSISKDKRRCN